MGKAESMGKAELSRVGTDTNPEVTNAPPSASHRSVFNGQNSTPFAVLKLSAINHNAAWMEEFVREHRATLAPHGKTSMSPEIFRWQLAEAGRWLTVASVSQAKVARLAGADRVLVANQVINASDLDYLVTEMNRSESFRTACFVDSLTGAQNAAAAVERNAGRRPLELMLEVGVPGGRAGVRDSESALEVASAIAATPHLSLVGVAGYEGIYSPKEEGAVAKVDHYLDTVVMIAEACANAGYFRSDEVTLSAGGSKFFDRVAERFARVKLGRPVRVQLRCGCYLFHDVGIYAEAMEMMRMRSAVAARLGPLRPAIEVWATVQSRPEPSRAIVDMGRRDVSFDAGLPTPLVVSRAGESVPTQLPEGCKIVKLNDQHGFLDVPPDADLHIGDAVGFGISHPCTVFDKWGTLYAVDDDYIVQELVHTAFRECIL